MIDVAPAYFAMIQDILKQYVPVCEVRAFGSRAKQTAKKYSDLDLAVIGKDKLASETLFQLREAFEESDLPFRVEVLDWQSISPEFRQIIDQEYAVIQRAA